MCWLSLLPLFVQLTSLRLHVHSHVGGCDVILRIGQGRQTLVGRAGGVGVVGAGVLLEQTRT